MFQKRDQGCGKPKKAVSDMTPQFTSVGVMEAETPQISTGRVLNPNYEMDGAIARLESW